MRVGIKFGDNDFHNTFNPLIRILPELMMWRDSGNKVTKEDIVELVNNISFGIYKFCQEREDDNHSYDEHHKNYLKIKADKVYIDDEIDELMKTYSQWGNGDFFYADLDNLQFQCM